MQPTENTSVAGVMREVQPVQHLDGDVQLALECERIAQRDHVGEIAALDQLHRDIELAVGFAEVVDRDDVGVLDGAGGPRFAEEPLLHVLRLAEARTQQLQRDVAPQHRVVGFPDDAHRSFAKELMQLVFPEATVALLRVAHRVNQSKARVKYERMESLTWMLRRGMTRSTIARNFTCVMRSDAEPPHANGRMYLGARTASNTLAPTPMMDPASNNVPIAVLA